MAGNICDDEAYNSQTLRKFLTIKIKVGLQYIWKVYDTF